MKITVIVLQDGLVTGLLSQAEFYALYPPVSAPPKEPVKPSPVVPDPPVKADPTPPANSLLGSLAGGRSGHDVFVAADGNWYYEVADGKLWPRGTNLPFDSRSGATVLEGNPCPAGPIGVPRQYVLPTGWAWFLAPDGAWAIVSKQTAGSGAVGPAWLTTSPVSQSLLNTPWTYNQPGS